METIILGPLRRKHQHLAYEIDLGPLKPTNLLSALARQYQQPDNISECIFVECLENLAEFLRS
jgi:hypothetical protein